MTPGGTDESGTSSGPEGIFNGQPSVKQLEEERFCISDDTCVDYSGTDYICVAGKCVPMGGQPAPIEPEQLDKPGGMAPAGTDGEGSDGDYSGPEGIFNGQPSKTLKS